MLRLFIFIGFLFPAYSVPQTLVPLVANLVWFLNLKTDYGDLGSIAGMYGN